MPRFHAVYWPALLLSAGVPLPTEILVHDYLTVEGRKLSKSNGNVIDPVAGAERFGTDAVRWWLLREVPRVGDADFTIERLAARSDEDLANGLGNLVNRVVSTVHRYRDGQVLDELPAPAEAERLLAACRLAPGLVDEALDAGDFRRAAAAVWTIVEEGNRYVEAARPWELARAERTAGEPPERLDAALGVLVRACRRLAEELAPFLPEAAARIAAQCAAPSGRLPLPEPLFTRIGSQSLEPAAG